MANKENKINFKNLFKFANPWIATTRYGYKAGKRAIYSFIHNMYSITIQFESWIQIDTWRQVFQQLNLND